MHWWAWILPITALATLPSLGADSGPAFRIERHIIRGGAELLTVFGHMSDARANTSSTEEVPLIAVLRDTLEDGNPQDDRLRYVWVLTSSNPSLIQRAASAIPFFYWRTNLLKNADHRPKPVIDLSNTSKPVLGALAGSVTQVLAFDPNGALIRSSTRSYRNNSHDHRQLHLLEGLAILSQVENVSGVTALLPEPQLLEIQARLALAGQTFGGLVSESKLPEAYMKQRIRTVEERGHNWELLRQRAEANGLYFEPFGMNGTATQALLWVARQDASTPREFDGQFLSIANPYDDARIKNWSGYTETVEWDGRVTEMVPLGLYSLEYPKVPLLLVDFRNTHGPKRREMVRHAFVDAVAGVAGYSKWGNWPYFAGSWTWNFVRGRHGAANSRTDRIRAYSQVRQWLALDPSLDPALRMELQKRLEILGVNPLEDNVFDEAKFAQRQYAALLRYADDPAGLEAQLERDRNSEATAFDHSLAGRTGFRLAHIMTLGTYTHHEDGSVLLAARRAYAQRLEHAADGAAGQ